MNKLWTMMRLGAGLEEDSNDSTMTKVFDSIGTIMHWTVYVGITIMMIVFFASCDSKSGQQLKARGGSNPDSNVRYMTYSIYWNNALTDARECYHQDSVQSWMTNNIDREVLPPGAKNVMREEHNHASGVECYYNPQCNRYYKQ